MKKALKIIGKISLGIICLVLILGFVNFEVYSINNKEYARQIDIANEAHKQIALNLNMIKIAVQTEDIEKYKENLSRLYENSAKIKPLFFLEDEQKDYLNSLYSYIELLENRKTLLSEIIKLKNDISAIEKVFKENYNGKDASSREKLTSLSSEIEKLKINEKDYSEEIIKNIISEINDLLNGIIADSSALSECIDNCYKDKITEINDGLAEKLKSFADKTEGLNQSLEDQFDFETLDKLKDY